VLTQQTGAEKYHENTGVCQRQDGCPELDRRRLTEELEENDHLLSLPTYANLAEAVL